MKNLDRLRFLSPQGINLELPLLIYLPGMDGTGELFELQATSLAAYFDIRCLHIPSDNTDGWQVLANRTSELIKSEIALNKERPIYLCGESFGGCLALQIALGEPSLIQRLILINPASSFNQRPLLSLGINITDLMPEWLHSFSSVSLLPFLAQLNRIDPSDRLKLIKAIKSMPPKIASWRMSLLQNFQVSTARLSNLNLPTLVIAGMADRLLPSIEEARRLVKILPKAKMAILPHSGHACLLETETNLRAILRQQQFLPVKGKKLVGIRQT